MILSHIVAISKNFVIGINNRLPWHMPSDMKYFQQVTKGHVIIMGRKNYVANGNKALRERTNIVLSRDTNLFLEDSIVAHSLDEAIEKAKSASRKEAFIIGGGEIYFQSIHIVNKIYLTLIDTIVEGDTYYPEIDFSKWKIVKEIHHNADKMNQFNWIYYILERPE